MLAAIALFQTALAAHPAADSSALRHADGRIPPTVTAIRVTRPPALDGRLDDAAWQNVPVVDGFRQIDPTEGAAASESTTVRIVYDDDAIYVGARLYDDEPSKIVRRLGRRDDDLQSDMFYVDFDSYHDHRTAFEFAVNPAGVKQDDITSNDFFRGDRSWEPVWDVATAVDSLGWAVEMRIPFSQLRFPNQREQLWGIQFFRSVFRKGELSQLAFVPKNESGYASRFAHLVGLRDVPAPRRLEVLPYTLGRGSYDAARAPGNPFDDGSKYLGGAGVDLKYGLTSNLTLDASINPDFGQVEQDPAFVNLTAFEHFFEERRPFFVEGASIFDFGGTGPYVGFGGTPQYFYSRRIGRVPELAPSVPDGGFVDVPATTTILGAAKLTGKSAGGWSLGLLDAVTGSEHARLDSAGTRSRVPVEPLSNYFVARVNREIAGRTGFGFLASAVQRRQDEPAFLALRRGAYMAAGDLFHRWDNNTYVLRASVGATHVTGDTVAIQETQLASSRYYGRPDASYLRFDPGRTSLNGVSADMSVTKEGGNTNWALGLSTTTPGFEINDLGFQRRVDRISGAVFLGHRWTRPGKVFRQASVSINTGPSWNYGGNVIQLSAGASVFGQLLNYWGGSLFATRQQQVVDDRLTRGGPLALVPAAWSVGTHVFSDQRQPVNGSVFAFYSHDAAGSWNLELSPELSVHPSSAVVLRLGPSYSVGRAKAQFLEAVPDTLAARTFGVRYVFGELSSHLIDLTMRLNVTFTPTLSFQLYAQPFAFAADYSQIQELRAARTFDFTVYGRDAGSTIAYDAAEALYTIDPDGAGPSDPLSLGNPNFRVRSLLTNAVLRWEYRPGSTLFLVWTQSRAGAFADPTFDVAQDLGRQLFHDPPNNVLLVKLNYWLSL
jgi:hypothetical protein